MSSIGNARPQSATGTDDLRLIARISRMYHEQGLRQTEIANRLHLSQTRVSRLLQKAVELGIVRTVVTLPEGVHAELEETLEQRYGLEEVVVADVHESDGSPLRALGAAAAHMLEVTLGEGDVVGISSWSETLLSAVNSMRPLRGTGAEAVVQLVGGRGSPRVQVLATGMLERLGALLGAPTHFLLTPAVLGSAQARNELLRDRALQDVIEAWDRITVALVGIGNVRMSPMLAQSGVPQEATDRQALEAAGAVGDVCLRYFDSDGDAVKTDFDRRVLAIDETRLKRIPRRIGVAGGLDKHRAVRAAILGGWINVLITDSELAHELANGE
ncbi:MAG TPA: MarR family transcriptional regulator [Actinomycetales bacterium]|nr:MarR family transcriptional regulator [Actinomycetales bacterium]